MREPIDIEKWFVEIEQWNWNVAKAKIELEVRQLENDYADIDKALTIACNERDELRELVNILHQGR